jgi:nitrite reductase/ring-hydroxylating ferredoxin subunit
MKTRLAKAQIVKRLTLEGYKFREFTLEHLGRYAAADADWNYKDIPHLHYVHHLAEAVPTMVSDDFVVTLNTQKMFGMKVPLSVVNYESGANEQTYYTTLFFFVLIIQTKFSEVEPLKTRVATTYSVGMPPLLLWLFPLLRWTITKNYRVLMSTDIPMRERRGELRSRGFGFKCAGPSYSFADTQVITRTNLVPPVRASDVPAFNVDLKTALPADGETFFGTNDDLGLRARRSGNVVMLYPRVCPHEGSCLDDSAIRDGRVQCPWHGREFAPICTVDLTDAQSSGDYLSEFSRVAVNGSTISLFARAR